jgi:hypothetical protein
MPHRGEVVVFQPPKEAYIGVNPALMLREWLEKHPDGGGLNPEEIAIIGQAVEMSNWPGVKQHPMNWSRNTEDNVRQVLAVLPTLSAQRDAFIKRVIGLPGDRIHIIKNDGIYLNGKRLQEPYLHGSAPHASRAFPAPDPPLFLRLGRPPRCGDVRLLVYSILFLLVHAL